MRRIAIVVVLGAALAGCPRLSPPQGTNGACADDPDGPQKCTDRCEEIVAPYREPTTEPSSTANAQCRRNGTQVGCACGALFINDNGCGAVGRPGDCLHDPAAFPGCTADSESGDAVCAIVCADLDEARRDDADGRDDIVVLAANCEGGCECAVGFGGSCLVVFADDESLPNDGVTAFPFNDAAGCP